MLNSPTSQPVAALRGPDGAATSAVGSRSLSTDTGDIRTPYSSVASSPGTDAVGAPMRLVATGRPAASKAVSSLNSGKRRT